MVIGLTCYTTIVPTFALFKMTLVCVILSMGHLVMFYW